MNTIDNSIQWRLATLQAKWMWDSVAAKKLQEQLWTTQVNNNSSSNFTGVSNPDGTPVSTQQTTQPMNIPVVQPTPVISWAQGIGNMPTSNATMTTTGADVASDNRIEADKLISDTAKSEASSQAALTSELSSIDKAQLDTKIANEKATSAEYEAIQKQQIVDKTANELEYQKSLQENRDSEISALQAQQQSENAANAAAAAELKAKNDASEYEMKTNNEIAQQQANIAFAKLWLSFSWAAINTATQIYTQWIYNLAKLKTTNAKNYADLQVKINSVAFEHTKDINKLITQSAEKEFASKERLREFIWNTQNNILNNRKESQDAIQKAITTYKTERQQREDKLYADMNAANARLQSATQDIQKTIELEEQNSNKKIDLLIANGQWWWLSPQQRIELESRAWVPAWSTANKIVAKTTQMLTDELKSIWIKNASIPPVILAKMHTEVQRALNLSIPLITATKMAVEKYKAQLPWYQAMISEANTKSELDASKINLNNANANKAISQWTAALKKSTWWSSGSWWAIKWKRYAWVTDTWQALVDVGWVPHILNTDGSVWWVYQWQVFSQMWTTTGWDIFNPVRTSPYINTPQSSQNQKTSSITNKSDFTKSLWWLLTDLFWRATWKK